MNWTFSISANLILFILFTFSVTSFAIFFFNLSKLKNLVNKVKFELESKIATEEEFSLILLPIERMLDWLPALASLAMLLGLLGTVVGIYSSFAEMQLSGKATIDVLAGGIKDALVTTIAGLVVAIPCLFLSQYLENELSKLEEVYTRAILRKK